ncbi:MAG: VOC family protein [Flavobacteriales bacterium]|nr:VOC family protein [Flavobacteriales bacterium]
MKTAIAWFEIPVLDMNRAKKFYEAVTGDALIDHDMSDPNTLYSVFPYERGQGVGGALMKHPECKPSMDGVTIYIPGGDDLSPSLERAEKAGAKIILPKTSIGENGFMAQFIDTEGNRIALHSMQ